MQRRPTFRRLPVNAPGPKTLRTRPLENATQKPSPPLARDPGHSGEVESFKTFLAQIAAFRSDITRAAYAYRGMNRRLSLLALFAKHIVQECKLWSSFSPPRAASLFILRPAQNLVQQKYCARRDVVCLGVRGRVRALKRRDMSRRPKRRHAAALYSPCKVRIFRRPVQGVGHGPARKTLIWNRESELPPISA
jgi:hypothetical protein